MQNSPHGEECPNCKRLRELIHERLFELVDDLRCYTHNWDWKYGEYWDKEYAEIKQLLQPPQQDSNGGSGEDPLITVCDVCLQASCWQGEFMCDEAQGAGTRELRLSKLAALNLEHPDYWKKDPNCQPSKEDCKPKGE